MVALEPVKTTAFGAHPYIPGVVDRDRQHIGMRKPFHHADPITHHAIQSRGRAHQNRTIVTLRQTGDQFVFQQENAFVLCWNSVCVVQQSGVRTHPKAALLIAEQGAYRIGERFPAEQNVLEGSPVVAEQSIEPRADPDVAGGVFRECSNRRRISR